MNYVPGVFAKWFPFWYWEAAYKFGTLSKKQICRDNNGTWLGYMVGKEPGFSLTSLSFITQVLTLL